jgi:AraC-like DNA-binding protein
MAGEDIEVGVPAGASFITTDPDLGMEHMSSAYQTSMRLSGRGHRSRFAHSRLVASYFTLDFHQFPLEITFNQGPLNALVIAELSKGRVERRCNGIEECFSAGDLFIDADPQLPATMSMDDVRGRAAKLDLSVLARVATSPGGGAVGRRPPAPIQFTGFQPVTPAAGRYLTRTMSYLWEIMANPTAESQPLIQASAADMLAASVLAAFPNTAVAEPTAQDRHDATTATLRRAVAFIEQNAERDITLADIADAASVGIRAVQVAFRRHLDTTPMRYLRGVRLDGAHRELRRADPTRGVTVTDVAMRWGFYSHSRFAAWYRTTYGVSPRRTLHTG